MCLRGKLKIKCVTRALNGWIGDEVKENITGVLGVPYENVMKEVVHR